MEIVRTISDMKLSRQRLTKPVGFVPTMGFLHEGHLSLVRRARSENSRVIVSIFVNPTQFGPNEDFETYPRDTERDLALLKQENTDVVFMTEPEEIYPPNAGTWVEVFQTIRLPTRTPFLAGNRNPAAEKGLRSLGAHRHERFRHASGSSRFAPASCPAGCAHIRQS